MCAGRRGDRPFILGCRRRGRRPGAEDEHLHGGTGLVVEMVVVEPAQETGSGDRQEAVSRDCHDLEVRVRLSREPGRRRIEGHPAPHSGRRRKDPARGEVDHVHTPLPAVKLGFLVRAVHVAEQEELAVGRPTVRRRLLAGPNVVAVPVPVNGRVADTARHGHDDGRRAVTVGDYPRVGRRSACVRLIDGGYAAVAGDQVVRVEPAFGLTEVGHEVAEAVVHTACQIVLNEKVLTVRRPGEASVLPERHLRHESGALRRARRGGQRRTSREGLPGPARRGLAAAAQSQQPGRGYDPDQDRRNCHRDRGPAGSPAAARTEPIRPAHADPLRSNRNLHAPLQRPIRPCAAEHVRRSAVADQQASAAAAAVQVRQFGRCRDRSGPAGGAAPARDRELIEASLGDVPSSQDCRQAFTQGAHRVCLPIGSATGWSSARSRASLRLARHTLE